MNIFFLDEDIQKSVEYHVQKHIVKMPLETAQLLSTAHRFIDGIEYTEKTKNNRNIKRWKLSEERERFLYKGTHINHPCSIWARESIENYIYLYNFFIALSEEYKFRYKREHLSFTKLKDFLKYPPSNIPIKSMTIKPQAMPDKYKNESAIIAYRNYYNGEKRDLFSWGPRQIPEWVIL